MVLVLRWTMRCTGSGDYSATEEMKMAEPMLPRETNDREMVSNPIEHLTSILDSIYITKNQKEKKLEMNACHIPNLYWGKNINLVP